MPRETRTRGLSLVEGQEHDLCCLWSGAAVSSSCADGTVTCSSFAVCPGRMLLPAARLLWAVALVPLAWAWCYPQRLPSPVSAFKTGSSRARALVVRPPVLPSHIFSHHVVYASAGGGGFIGNGNSGNGDGGNDGLGGDFFGGWRGGGGSDGEGELEITTVLAGFSRTFSSLPTSVQKAVLAGTLTPALLKRYLSLERGGPFLRWVLSIAGFRDRVLMDPSFLTKLGIEMSIGAAAQTLAEWERRRERLWLELDFAFADILTCLVANFAAVWLSAPALGKGMVSATARNIPDNAFQRVPPGCSPYTRFDRFMSPFAKAPNLFAVGFFATLVGYGSTYALQQARKYLNKNKGIETAPSPEIPVLNTCLAVGGYLAISTNLRYQIISGLIEQRFLDVVLKDRQLLSNACSFLVRSANTYLGSAMMIDYLKLVGLQGE